MPKLQGNKKCVSQLTTKCTFLRELSSLFFWLLTSPPGFAIQLVSGEPNISRSLPPHRHPLQKAEKSKGDEIKHFMMISIHILGRESVEPVGEVHPDVGGPHHHLHHRQPLPPLLAKYVLFQNSTVSYSYRAEP